jgi:hypothetical protein
VLPPKDGSVLKERKSFDSVLELRILIFTVDRAHPKGFQVQISETSFRHVLVPIIEEFISSLTEVGGDSIMGEHDLACLRQCHYSSAPGDECPCRNNLVL